MATQAAAELGLGEQSTLSPSPADMSDAELLDHLQSHVFGPLKRRLRDHLPYLMEARERFGAQGRRVPIKGNPSWTEFCEEQLGVGVRSVQKLLAEGKKKSEATKKKPQRQKYDAVDIAHLEKVARAAQQVAEADPDNEEYNSIREAIADKPILSSPGEAPTKPDPALGQQVNQDLELAIAQDKVGELELEIGELEAQIENLKTRLQANTKEVPEHLRDENITASLAAEPDRGIASEMLRQYLKTVIDRVLPPHMLVLGSRVYVPVEIVGRDHRIMIGDWLQKQNKGGGDLLAKCTAIGECEQRRRVREWDGRRWGKEHVVYSGDDGNYKVITETAARLLAPGAFEESKEVL
jgi:hypothetical protein